MKIFVPSSHRLSKDVADMIERDGYDEIVYDTHRYGMRESVRAMTLCDAFLILTDGDENPIANMLRSVASMCGLSIVEVRSYSMAERIIKAVTSYYGVGMGKIRATGRSGKVVASRKMIAYLMNEYNISIRRIQAHLNRDRGSVNYYIKTERNNIRYDKKIAQDYRSIKESISEADKLSANL